MPIWRLIPTWDPSNIAIQVAQFDAQKIMHTWWPKQCKWPSFDRKLNANNSGTFASDPAGGKNVHPKFFLILGYFYP